MLSLISVAVGLLSLTVQAQNAIVDFDPTSDPNTLSYKSRPGLYPPRLYVNISEAGISEGYIFMAPYQSYQNSAVIYDSNGEVVWFGFGETGSGNVQDFQYLGYSRGQSYIVDTNLNLVKTVQSLGGLSPVDQHEFNIIGDSALIDIYQPTRYDLSEMKISTGQGWVMDCIFQEVNLTTGELLFEWSALDHVALSESGVPVGSTNVAGSGFNPITAYDPYHLNSIDKNADGDYLVSLRHTSTLYKINGTDGNIIWRCGGNLSDFTLLNGLNFSSQHDARWLSSNASTDVISFFDNASDGTHFSSNHSSGLIIKINHDAQPPSVEAVRSLAAPANQSISTSQGNVQILDKNNYLTSNAFVGWGSSPSVSEYDSNGNIIYYANIVFDGPMNYRAFKFNIDLVPKGSPALYTYALSEQSDTIYYMSWNGCTNCTSWRIYGRSSCDNDYTLIGNVTKSGFETNYTASGFQEYGLVEAVDSSGTGLRNSTIRGVKAFVPSQPLNQYCNSTMCQPASQYVVAAGNFSVAQTRSACATQPVSTTAASASSTSSSSSKGNTGSTLRPEMMMVAVMGLVSTVLLVATL